MKELAIGLVCLILGITLSIRGGTYILHRNYAKVASDGYCVYSNQVYRMEPVTGSGDTCDEEDQ